MYNVLVIYGDGSANNANGEYGSGYTGYIYDADDTVEKNNDKPAKYLVTDKGYLEEELANRIDHQIVKPSFYIDGIIGYKDKGTNNVGEVKAFTEMVKNMFPNGKNEYEIKKLIFKTDSSYTKLVIDYILTMAPEDWAKKLNSNVELVAYVHQQIKDLKAMGIEIQTMKVIGHGTSLGNNTADALANYGRFNNKPYHVCIPADKHWTMKQVIHPLLRFRQLFFISNDKNPEHMYTIMDYKTDVEIGRKTHQAVFGVVFLKEGIPEIDNCCKIFNSQLGNSLNIVSTIDLRNLYTRNNMYYLEQFGDHIYRTNTRNRSVCAYDNTVVASQIYPSGLAVQAYDKILYLRSLLKNYQGNILAKNIEVIDVTEYFYTVEQTKTKTKVVCTIPNGINNLDIKVKAFGKDLFIPLALGDDCITRNQFKAMEKTIKRVAMMCIKYDNVVEYHTIVETLEGEIGIFTNLYSCKIFLEASKEEKK